MRLRSSPEGVRWGHEVRRWQASHWVCPLRSSKKEDVWLRFVDLVVNPSARLLHSDAAPLGLVEQLSLIGDFLVDLLGEDDMPVLIVVVEIFLGILYFGGIVRHNYYIDP